MNSSYRSLAFVLIVAGSLLLLPHASLADDPSVYESLSDVPIGRVFFSPAQRIHLDKNRASTSQGIPAASNARVVATKNEAAGFIISDSGLKQIYTNGDFVKTENSTTVAFPGDVTVVRQPHVDEEAADESD